MELKSVAIRIPDEANVIIGQAHFIKTVEDLAEIMAATAPNARYGLAFNESSGPCLIRVEGNDADLKSVAVENAQAIGAGHVFVLLLRDAYPIQVLDRVKACMEVCTLFCATANPVEVIVADSGRGRGVLGVVDGAAPKAVESAKDVVARKELLRKFGYKL